MNWSLVNKPTLMLNKEICLHNIRKMYNKVVTTNVLFRPHFKTHQSRIIANWFKQEGVTAITVSSVTMAEYFAEDGWKDITIAFPFNPLEWKRIHELAKTCKINVLISNLESAFFLSSIADVKVGAFIEIDAGYHRSGINAGNLGIIIKTVEVIVKNNNVQFMGILSHFGNSYSEDIANIPDLWNTSLALLNTVKEELAKFGDCIISVGDTPCCTLLHDFSVVSEIRPGNFVFYDVMQYSKSVCMASEIAVSVACPVIDIHPERNEVVIYGGGVHLSKEFISETNGDRNYGLICHPTDKGWSLPVSGACLCNLSQEHGVIRAPETFIKSIKIGDLVIVLPIHSCLTAQCFKFYTLLNGELADHM